MQARGLGTATRRLLAAAAAAALASACGGNSGTESPRLIAFARAPATNAFSDIYLLQTDGSLRRLTHGGIDSEPSWSPDGGRLAFLRARRNGSPSLYIARADGSGQRELPYRVSDHAVWSPDGRRILFAHEGVIAVAIPESGDTRRTLLDPSPAMAGDAHWSPDGSRIVYVLGPDGTSGDVYVMNANGSGSTRLTRLAPGAGRPYMPSWSPDGTRIAFLLPASLDVMNADGSERETLARFGDRDFPSSLAWSPDGDSIAFARLRLHGNRRSSGIYVVRVESGDLHRLTREIDSTPSWSPDGRKIVFQRLVGFHVSEISLMDPDGSDQKTLTEGGWSDTSPTWQPGE
jgi:Tol biopolymer transport system component